MNRRELLTAAAGMAGAALMPAVASRAQTSAGRRRPPNIIVLFIDDLSWGDVGAFGCPDIPTPHIDSLAREGVRCTNAYTACPVCTPSRTALMMGMYTQRFGVNGNDDRGAPIPGDLPTVAEFMQQAGYVTGMVGRWDVGSIEQGPLTRGFMEMARRSMIDPEHALRAQPKGPTYYQRDGVYWTTRQGEELAEFVHRHAREPFFLYFAPLAVHFPVQEVPQAYLDRVPHIEDERRRQLAATLVATDDAIGKLLAAVREAGLDEETLILFTSDNGGSQGDHARTAPSCGGKASEWDGAVRVPTIARWTGRLPAGRNYDGLISTMDVYATAAHLAGQLPPPHVDGVNLMPYLTGESHGDAHEHLFFRWIEGDRPDVHAVRSDQWRLVRTEEGPWRLYDLEVDRGEQHDVAAEYPDVVARLTGQYEAWAGRMQGPTGAGRQPGGWFPTGIGWATPDDPPNM